MRVAWHGTKSHTGRVALDWIGLGWVEPAPFCLLSPAAAGYKLLPLLSRQLERIRSDLT